MSLGKNCTGKNFGCRWWAAWVGGLELALWEGLEGEGTGRNWWGFGDVSIDKSISRNWEECCHMKAFEKEKKRIFLTGFSPSSI